MKNRIVLIVMVMLFAYSLVMAGAKSIKDYQSSKSITLVDSATTTSNTGYFPSVPITDAGRNITYDRLNAVVWFSDMTGSDTALGNTDTVIVAWKFRFGDSTIVARTDTGLPPCQFIYNYSDDPTVSGTILGDSTAVIYSTTYAKPFLEYDDFWFEYNVADSALATDSTGVTTMRYTVRLIENWD